MSGIKKNAVSCFIDSNVWLYAFIETSSTDENRKRQIAKKIVQVDNIFISTAGN